MNPIETATHAGKTVKVYIDEDPINPRTDYDNVTIISHWHRRYNLGENQIESCNAETLIDERKDTDPILAIMPLYLYDHSGISISVGKGRSQSNPFPCEWDSGQVGWVFITQSKSDMMGCPGYTVEQYEEMIRSDVQTFDDYLTGRVYGYVVEGRDGNELESCWGFIGDSDDCLAEGKSAAESCEDPAMIRAVEELNSRATYANV